MAEINEETTESKDASGATTNTNSTHEAKKTITIEIPDFKKSLKGILDHFNNIPKKFKIIGSVSIAALAIILVISQLFFSDPFNKYRQFGQYDMDQIEGVDFQELHDTLESNLEATKANLNNQIPENVSVPISDAVNDLQYYLSKDFNNTDNVSKALTVSSYLYSTVLDPEYFEIKRISGNGSQTIDLKQFDAGSLSYFWFKKDSGNDMTFTLKNLSSIDPKYDKTFSGLTMSGNVSSGSISTECLLDKDDVFNTLDVQATGDWSLTLVCTYFPDFMLASNSQTYTGPRALNFDGAKDSITFNVKDGSYFKVIKTDVMAENSTLSENTVLSESGSGTYTLNLEKGDTKSYCILTDGTWTTKF